MAMLDPIARHDFMATVLTATADDGVSVVLSSHVLAELERVADYLSLMSRGSVQVAGEIDDLLACHRVLTGPAAEAGRYAERLCAVHARRGEAQAHLLVRTNGTADPVRRAGRRIRSASIDHDDTRRGQHQPIVIVIRQAPPEESRLRGGGRRCGRGWP